MEAYLNLNSSHDKENISTIVLTPPVHPSHGLSCFLISNLQI